MCCLFADLSALFTHTCIYTFIYIYIEAQCTRQHQAQIDEKNIETTCSLLRFSFSILCLLPYILLRLEVSTSLMTTTSITYSSRWSLSSVRRAANETSVQERFCFAKKKGNRPFLTLTLSSFLLLLSILLVLVSVLCCVCVCVCGGQILFPVNCGGRRRFFPSSFHSHSHMPLIFFSFILLPKKKEKREIFLFFIHTYLF